MARIWTCAEQGCGKRLAPALDLWRPHYARHSGSLLPTQKNLLRAISAAPLDRRLADSKTRASGGLSGPRPGTLLRHQGPIQGEVWNERRLGFREADRGAHCGGSLAGNFIWSLTDPDLASTWTEDRAVWNKGAHGVLEQTKHGEQTLPCAIRGFAFDNGSAWRNGTLIRDLQVRPRPLRVPRSRPYHSDDTAHGEQKNWMWPRQLLGYGRLEDEPLLGPINALYPEAGGPRHNGFRPSMKLVKKWREGRRWGRRHDAPQTADQRLLAHGELPPKARRARRDQDEALGPFALAAEVERRLKPILGAALAA